MLGESEQKIRSEGFGNKLTATTTKWTQVQLWKTIKLLVDHDYVPYDDLLFKVFGGDNEALKSLIEDNLLGISKDKGSRLVSSPSTLYHSAFRNMLANGRLRLMMDMQEKKSDLNKDLDEVQKIEDELTKLQRAESEKINDAMIAIAKRREALQLRLAELVPKIAQKEKEYRALEVSLKS